MDNQPKPRRSKRGCFIGCGIFLVAPFLCVGIIFVALLSGIVSLPYDGLKLGSENGYLVTIQEDPFPANFSKQTQFFRPGQASSGHTYIGTGKSTECEDYAQIFAGGLYIQAQNCKTYFATPGTSPSVQFPFGPAPVPTSTAQPLTP